MSIARLIADPAKLETWLGGAPGARAGLALDFELARLGEELFEMRFAEGEESEARAFIDEEMGASAALIARGEIAVPNLFVSDMDSTMIGQECIDELADFAGLKPQIAAITERAMRGEIDFVEALNERVALLAGLEERAISDCLDERIRPSEGARNLVQTLGAHGCRTVLVTGGFHQFADPVAQSLGFDRVVGNTLECAGGKLTGGLRGEITDSSVKLAVLEAERAALGGGLAMAIGDGANDIAMIRAADLGVAYCAKPKARAAANGWVDRPDLAVLLELLGIASVE